MNSPFEKAVSHYQAGQFQQAKTLVAAFNKQDQYATLNSVVLEGHCNMALGLAEPAVALYQKALLLTEDNAARSGMLFNLYKAELANKNPAVATAHLVDASECAPPANQLKYRFSLAEAYFRNGKFKQAIAAAEALSAHETFAVKALLLMVNCALELLDLENLNCYLRQLEEKADQLSPAHLNELASLICFYRDGDIDRSLQMIVKKGADENVVNSRHALHCFNQGDIEKATQIVNGVELAKLKADRDKANYFGTLAKIALQKQQYTQAYEYSEKMNAIVRAQLAGKNWRANDSLPLMRALPEVSHDPRSIPEQERLNIAFMVGFPRSGTTLLETILDSIDQVTALSERPLLAAVMKKIHQDGKAFPDCLLSMDASYRDELRTHYLETAKSYLVEEGQVQDTLLIDKNPLAMQQIPLILSLFPEAKIVLSVRHPLDCVLSCFMQNFKPSPQLAYFTDLQNTCERYAQLFDAYDQYKAMYGFDDFVIRYEDLVEDVNGTVTGMLDYLGLNTSAADFSQYRQHAKDRAVRTPSASQVKQGIYTHATYRWEHFRELLAPLQHIVQPYVEKFGYPSIDG